MKNKEIPKYLLVLFGEKWWSEIFPQGGKNYEIENIYWKKISILFNKKKERKFK